MLNRLADWFNPEEDEVPNRLTIGMGKLVRQAREQASMSQAELARRIYRRQASLSNIENGKMNIDASTLLYLAGALLKPITYFFPKSLLGHLEPEPETPEEKELLIQAKRLSNEDLTGIIAQVSALADVQDARLRQKLTKHNK
jgi:transcriptional regulator with XRE-family HTH domain